MLEIEYCEDGLAYSDFDLLEKANEIISEYKKGELKNIKVSTSNIVEAIRLLASRGLIQNEELTFKYNDEVITLTEDIKFSKYPKGFLDWEDDILDEILIRRTKSRNS